MICSSEMDSSTFGLPHHLYLAACGLPPSPLGNPALLSELQSVQPSSLLDLFTHKRLSLASVTSWLLAAVGDLPCDSLLGVRASAVVGIEFSSFNFLGELLPIFDLSSSICSPSVSRFSALLEASSGSRVILLFVSFAGSPSDSLGYRVHSFLLPPSFLFHGISLGWSVLCPFSFLSLLPCPPSSYVSGQLSRGPISPFFELCSAS